MKACEMDLPAARIEPFDQLDHLSLRPARLEAWNHNSDRHRSGERHDAHLSKRNATTVQKKRRDFPLFATASAPDGKAFRRCGVPCLGTVEVTPDRDGKLFGALQIGAALDVEDLVIRLPQQFDDCGEVRKLVPGIGAVNLDVEAWMFAVE